MLKRILGSWPEFYNQVAPEGAEKILIFCAFQSRMGHLFVDTGPRHRGAPSARPACRYRTFASSSCSAVGASCL